MAWIRSVNIISLWVFYSFYFADKNVCFNKMFGTMIITEYIIEKGANSMNNRFCCFRASSFEMLFID